LFKDGPKQGGQKRNEALRSTATCNFELVEGYLLLETELNGAPATYLIDTSAPLMVLNQSYQGKNPTRKLTGIPGVQAQDQALGLQKIDKFVWGGGVYQNFEAIVKDLSAYEEKLGRKLAGLLSINELEAFECLFDYQKKQLTLYGLKPDGKPFESLKIPAARLSVPFELVAQRPLIKIKIGKSNLKVVLDNTVQTNLLSSGLLKKFSKLLLEAKTEASKSAEGSSITATRAKIAICKLGKLDYREMEYLFTDTAHLGKTGKLKPDGVLGQDFLVQMP
jgi:hypothetical protein